jgi:hypothetical protein
LNFLSWTMNYRAEPPAAKSTTISSKGKSSQGIHYAIAPGVQSLHQMISTENDCCQIAIKRPFKILSTHPCFFPRSFLLPCIKTFNATFVRQLGLSPRYGKEQDLSNWTVSFRMLCAVWIFRGLTVLSGIMRFYTKRNVGW